MTRILLLGLLIAIGFAAQTAQPHLEHISALCTRAV